MSSLNLANSSLATICFIIVFMLFFIRLKKLTIWGGITGMLVGIPVFLGAGWWGLLYLGIFFLLGTLATAHGKQHKLSHDDLEQQSTGRRPGQVFANGGIAALMAILAIFDHKHTFLYHAMMVGSLAAATADTLSSELGTVYGKKFVNVLSFKPDERGLDGVISLEGTIIGAAGSLLLAILFSIQYGFGAATIVIAAAGVIGNYVDSILGAVFERRLVMTNNMVNVCNTAAGAVVTALLLV
ncbi:DUF92 domain-containing protein [Chitinophaga skermanii]